MKIQEAAKEAAAAGMSVEMSRSAVEIARKRRNYFFVYVSFKDGTGTMSDGLRNTTEINTYLSELGQAEIQDVKVVFGQVREAKVTRKVSFR